MEKAAVLHELQKSPKGCLSYYPRVPSLAKLKRHHGGSVNLSSMKTYLENCEEEAHADEEEFMRKEQLKQIAKLNKQTKTFVTELGEYLNFSDYNDCRNAAMMHQLVLNTKQEGQSIVQKKTKAYQSFEKEAHELFEEKVIAIQKKETSRMEAERKKILEFNESSKKSLAQIKEVNVEQHKQRVLTLKTRMQEAEKRKQLKLEQGKKRFDLARSVFEQCFNDYNSVEEMVNNTAVFGEFLKKAGVKSSYDVMKNTYSNLCDAFQHCQKQEITEQVELDNLTDLNQKFKNEYHVLLSLLKELEVEAEKQRQEAEKQRQEAEKQKQAQRETDIALKPSSEPQDKSGQTAHDDTDPELSYPPLAKELVNAVSRSAYHQYKKVTKLSEEFEEVVKKISSSKQHQSLVMGINNSVSLTVSSISTRSGSEIKNKLSDLNNLLKGQSVKFKNQRVSVNDHPDGVRFACYCLAKKFVTQGKAQVASNPSNAFSFALAIAGVWEQHKVVGELFLGLIQNKCPFIVPWTVPKLSEHSELQHKCLLGYICKKDGSVEDQDLYLKRMSGFVRIYAAIIQSPLPPGANSHPHGIEEGWKWLTRMLNLDPLPEVTATVLYNFLDVVSHKMSEVYGKQFDKLLYSLCHDYFPRIKQTELGVSSGKPSTAIGGPLVRLENFLKDCLRTKPISKPKGHLSASFWNTYHHSDLIGN